TAYAEDPDIIEASFVASPPRSARKSSASTAASSSDSRAKPGPAQHEKPLLTQQQQQRGSEGASAPQPPAGPEKSPLKRSATTPEAKRSSYLAYLHRDGPKHLGELRLPKAGEAKQPQRHDNRGHWRAGLRREGGLRSSAASVRRQGYQKRQQANQHAVVVGREPGASKLDKAKQAGVRCCPEKEFYSFLCEKLGQPPEADPDDEAVEMMGVEPGAGTGAGADQRSNGSSVLEMWSAAEREGGKAGAEGQPQQQLMWVDKYKPRSLKQIIGQSGPASCASKLVAWLSSWHRHLASGVKRGVRAAVSALQQRRLRLEGGAAVRSARHRQDDHRHSGLQGARFECLELNASDTRNKRSLHEIVGEALGTFSVGAMFGGGVAELIQLIKASQVPIICICNDRNHMKMRSLANYCFDLRFQRPRPEQIRAAAMSIASREGLKVDAQALLDVINASNNDVRQTIHNLQQQRRLLRWCRQLRKDASRSRKDLRFGPFDLVRKALSSDEMADKSINQLSDLFFQDYNMEPLFIQENYPLTEPDSLRSLPSSKRDLRRLQLLSQAADSIALGDVCGRSVPLAGQLVAAATQALFSSGLPASPSPATSPVRWPSRPGLAGIPQPASRQAAEPSGLPPAAGVRRPGASRDLGLDMAQHLAAALTRPLRQNGADGVPACAPAKRKAAASSAGAEEFDEEAADYGEGGGVAEEEAGKAEEGGGHQGETCGGDCRPRRFEGEVDGASQGQEKEVKQRSPLDRGDCTRFSAIASPS
uniref:G_PROTEIN_RECEP_F3_4 domain-containing protein n=1 Tax=Macrostomum lignano TaxID=282301 RepID=A0A1I8F3M7_9PLAT